MILQVSLLDLRQMIFEKCEEIIADKGLARELYDRIIEIEDDRRFKDVVIDDLKEEV